MRVDTDFPKLVTMTMEESQRLVHELQVHQIELKMQNEELGQARDEADKALSKFTNLYDFAPVGYFTLNKEGAIHALNFSGAKLMKSTRSHLVGISFRSLVAAEARCDFDAFLLHVFKGQGKKVWDVALDSKGGRPFFVRIEAIFFNAEEEFLIAVIDISERKQTEEKLLASQKSLRDFTKHLQKTREEERSKIAREIHDELGQVLATVRMGMSLLAANYLDHPIPTAGIYGCDQLIMEAIKTVQRISAELRPVMLDTLGLGEAIDWQAKEFKKRTGIDCTTNIFLQSKDFNPEVATAVFRIFQESLTNIIRHSEATHVTCSLNQKRNRLILIVRDNGRGITREQSRNSHALGIMGMRERAWVLGGRLKIFATSDKGTAVIAHIPVNS